MADIRINALATTAASTASDDFVAVDGSANGTRKLNAYSPTFGGNLTVSGTGTVTGDVTITRANSGGGVGVRNVNTDSSGYASLSLNNSGGTAQSFDIGTGGSAVAITALRQKLYIYDNTAGTTVMRLSGGSTSAVEFLGTGTHSFGGNLTVSGGDTTVSAGKLKVYTGNVSSWHANIGSGANSGLYINGLATTQTLLGAGMAFESPNWMARGGTTASGYHLNAGAHAWYGDTGLTDGASFTPTSRMTLSTAGNLTLQTGNLTVSGTGNSSVAGTLLVATTTNSSNGIIQLATHTTSAGGIGFGTDVSLYRATVAFYGFPAVNAALFRSSGSNLIFSSTNYNHYIGQKGDSGDFFISATDSITLQTRGNASNGTTALTLDSSQRAQFAGTTDSSSSTTGALTVAGGVGIAKKLYVGDNIISTGSNAALFFNSRTGANSNYAWYSPDGTVARLYDNTNAKTLVDFAANTGDATFAGTIATQNGTASTPASASATGTAGTIKWDASYIYVCTATNTWKRVAIATWS